MTKTSSTLVSSIAPLLCRHDRVKPEGRFEEWKDIPDYEGLYQVSTMGRVKSLDRVVTQVNRWGGLSNIFLKGKILVQSPDNDGYLHIGLSKLGVQKTYTVHTLVAKTFIPNPKNKPMVNHMGADGDKTNNRSDNLEWVTGSENNMHAIRNRLRVKSTARAVAQYTQDGVLIKKYRTISKAALDTGISRYTISMSIIGNMNKHGFRVIE